MFINLFSTNNKQKSTKTYTEKQKVGFQFSANAFFLSEAKQMCNVL